MDCGSCQIYCNFVQLVLQFAHTRATINSQMGEATDCYFALPCVKSFLQVCPLVGELILITILQWNNTCVISPPPGVPISLRIGIATL
uniref:Uncharacterized protein n=1 Tax=Pyxicephalus adspersus TaxID=30357 RepID=A0AAV3AKT6_PYXAD|nr:TPA: hypothetical protein GDO54_008155 [Pyxicephalus adspersus]